jgi:hypothetical protein
MWLIHRGNRERIYNLDQCSKIWLIDTNNGDPTDYPDGVPDPAICFMENGNLVNLPYPTDDDVGQAFKYLLEGIRRGDKLINI